MTDSAAIERTTAACAWVVVCAGTTINLCLGILYAWSVWKANLVGNATHPARAEMSGLNEGWVDLTMRRPPGPTPSAGSRSRFS